MKTQVCRCLKKRKRYNKKAITYWNKAIFCGPETSRMYKRLYVLLKPSFGCWRR